MREAQKEQGFMTFVGFVAEQQEELEPQFGFGSVIGLFGFAFLTGAPNTVVKDHYDYVEVAADRKYCSSLPKSFGGVSGSAQHPVACIALRVLFRFNYDTLMHVSLGFPPISLRVFKEKTPHQAVRHKTGNTVNAHGQLGPGVLRPEPVAQFLSESDPPMP
jgi:hypothetical protein